MHLSLRAVICSQAHPSECLPTSREGSPLSESSVSAKIVIPRIDPKHSGMLESSPAIAAKPVRNRRCPATVTRSDEARRTVSFDREARSPARTAPPIPRGRSGI